MPTPTLRVKLLTDLVSIELNVADGDLDEFIHDLCEQDAAPQAQATEDEDAIEAIYDAAGERAARINNGGLESQVAYLLESLGTPEAVLTAVRRAMV